MIRKLVGLLGHPLTKAVIGVAVVGVGLQMLTDLAGELGARIDDLNTEIAEREAHLATLHTVNRRNERPYPDVEDVDPLARGEASLEFELKA